MHAMPCCACHAVLRCHACCAVYAECLAACVPLFVDCVLPACPAAGVVSLIKDLNGNHVVQRCLQRLGPEDSQFIYDAACANCVDIATHRHGCCVLQRCIDFATPTQKDTLIQRIAQNALVLSQVGRAKGNVLPSLFLSLTSSTTTTATAATAAAAPH
jgi:hypothetical protein